MRKRLKKKFHLCALCKPHKWAGTTCWKPKDAALLNEAEKELDAEPRFMVRVQKCVVKQERGLALLTKAASGLTCLTCCVMC